MPTLKLKLIATAILGSLWAAAPGAAATYYVCDNAAGADPGCVPGNDANNGTSPATPWRSFAKAMGTFNAMNGGDQVLFAKGGAWEASSFILYNSRARAASRATLADYTPPWASGDEAKPLLRNSAGGILQFADGGNGDHDEGYVVRNLRLQGAGTGNGIFFYNDVDDVLVENMEIDAFGIGVHLAGGNAPNAGADQENQRIRLRTSRITNCGGQGFLGAGDGLEIEGCYFGNNGFERAIYNHNIYVGSHQNATGVLVRNNELYRSAFINGKADGVSLVVHGSKTDLLIEGNYIHEDAGAATGHAWGIGVDYGGYPEPEGFTRVIIRGNRVVNMHNTGIGISGCVDTVIENNVVVSETAAGFTGISAPDKAVQTGSLVMTRVNIRNNSLYLRGANSSTRGIKLGDVGTGHSVGNNLVSLDGGSCLGLNLPTSAYTAVDHNLGQLLGAAAWCNGQSLASWRTATGLDLHSLTGDPLFVAPGAPNWNLALASASSPAVNAGSPTLAAPTDFTGAARGGTPDIGAFEYAGGPPDTTPPSVALTAPAAGATVSGPSVAVSAAASDNVGVAGVQFQLDGANLGAEDTVSPYGTAWNSTGATNGSHTLTALARDAAGNTRLSAAVTVTVANNLPPTLSNLADRSTNEDTATPAVAFTVGDAETAAGSLTVSGASGNTLLVPNANIVFGGSGAARTVTVTPAPNQSGTATITVSVSDGAAAASDSFVLTVLAVNDLPTLSTLADRSTNEDTTTPAVAFTVGDAETAVGSLTVSGASGNTALVPNANIVFGGSGAARTVTVTPAPNQSGTATITVSVSDGAAAARDSFLLTVHAVNDAPLAQDLSVTTRKRSSVAFTLGGSDVEGSSLTFALASQPANGTLSGTPPALSYRPNGSFSGTDSFTFRVHDGALGSNLATVTITVGRSAPVLASSLQASPNPALAGEAIAFQGAASDEDGDLLSYAWNFGDGGASAATDPKHAYAAPGEYAASLTVSDEDGLQVAQTLLVTVVPGGGGGSGDRDGDGVPDRIDPDNDNDGFTDAEEGAAGTDPHAASSVPGGAGSGGAPRPVRFASVKGRLNFAREGRDLLLVQGAVELPAGWSPENLEAHLEICGVARRFLLNARGQGVSGQDSFRLTVPGGRQRFPGGPVPFQLKLWRGSWAGQWEAAGVVHAAGGAGQVLVVRLALVLGGASFAGAVDAEFTPNPEATAARFGYGAR